MQTVAIGELAFIFNCTLLLATIWLWISLQCLYDTEKGPSSEYSHMCLLSVVLRPYNFEMKLKGRSIM